jgi:hypothetical protein
MSDDPAFNVLMANADAMKRGALPMWTIYDKPKDHPDGFIARLHEVAKGEPRVTGTALTGGLEEIRKVFWNAGLIRLTRDEKDDPQIVESWL